MEGPRNDFGFPIGDKRVYNTPMKWIVYPHAYLIVVLLAGCMTDRNEAAHRVFRRSTVTVNGYGRIDPATLAATNRYVSVKGSPSLYSERIVDAEKIDRTRQDDRGCGEAVGANLTVMTGWAERAGFADEDAIFRSFYEIFGTASYGVRSVVDHVFKRLPGYAVKDYLTSSGSAAFDVAVFTRIERWLENGYAVGLLYLHGTPAKHRGNHVITLWGLCKDDRFPSSDPRHYAAVIVSDSDDDKRGYATAEAAPNRVRILPVTWDGQDGVYRIANGYLAKAIALAPTP